MIDAPPPLRVSPAHTATHGLVRRVASRRWHDVPPLPQPPSLFTELRGPVTWGLVVLALIFGVGASWAARAPLAGAAIATGVVSPEGSRQTVQHLEGGIIREILVDDGDVVAAGDPLVVLEGVGARAEAGRLEDRLRSLAAREARLRAERAAAEDIVFDHPVLADGGDLEVAAALQAQRNQFEARRAADVNRALILRQRIGQLREQIRGYERQIEANRSQRALIEEEAADVEHLLRRGLERKARLLALQREQAALLGTEGELTASIARAREAMGETELQILDLRVQRTEEIDAEFAQVQTERAEIEEQLAAARDALSRTAILAPAAGTVLDLRFKTTGGVIRAGESVLDLVPLEDELIVEARLAPADIDDVAAGQPAHVVFPSLPQRGLLRIEGTVRSVSADALIDERTGTPYYLAKVEVDRAGLVQKGGEIVLTPGMPAEVFITTEERTFVDYVLQPIMQSFARTFRES